jgi:hypothetical protein
MLDGRRFAERRQGVQAASGPVLACRHVRIFPPALEQSHLLEPAEGAVERAVGGEQPGVGGIAERFRHFVAVELVFAPLAKRRSGRADGDFERNETSRFPAHGQIISRYMLLRQLVVKLLKTCASETGPVTFLVIEHMEKPAGN